MSKYWRINHPATFQAIEYFCNNCEMLQAIGDNGPVSTAVLLAQLMFPGSMVVEPAVYSPFQKF